MEKKSTLKISQSKEDKAIISLGQKHDKLVNDLKKALIIGNVAFIKAGQILKEIKEKKTFEAEDLAETWTWRQFLSRPDLPFPGTTPDSRRRTADALIRIYKIFIQKFALPKSDLASVGWTKLNLIAPICENEKITTVRDWLTKAQILTVPDLVYEIRDKDSEIGAGLTCQHLNEFRTWKCPDCGVSSKHKLSKAK